MVQTASDPAPRTKAGAIPASPDSVAQAVQRYEENGFGGQFAVRDAGQLECLSCKKVLPPHRVRMLAEHRIEGNSDPGDMAVVCALECGSCHARGTAVFGFGPEASAEDKIAFAGLTDRRGKMDDLPSGL